ncbi:hypothetical protein I545_5586 [Mycobacterium kansasii 662]|uniref:Uncharacterized protein n=2 Tax=Mycobacterium kansasii TaxID=1768 RepID=A0A1V3WHL5_MYCKA|nr:hypothetical protein I547_6493 [Mycobacterium kansasii 824]EUA10962.1 hypothetical protein I545_5586 [Mycobacterium kansasii 662]KEP42255.1 hypothetical protein MKSMC1_26320 [Mycobacterium kansasii]OOK66459.1 hypothetical protein BZL30_8291 [Mycobacterium kansasii]OOK77615.1 hypothetical protein BZL29_3200 [Mycobacterium kansasii]
MRTGIGFYLETVLNRTPSRPGGLECWREAGQLRRPTSTY